MKNLSFLALAIVLMPSHASALCSGVDKIIRPDDALEYILRNADVVGIGIIESSYAPGVSEQRVRPLRLNKGTVSGPFIVGEAAGLNGTIKLDTTGRNLPGEIGSIVLFSLSWKGDRLVRSECSTRVLEGPYRVQIAEALLKTPL